MTDDRILIERAQGIGRITIANERRRNALSLRMWGDIGAACTEFENDPSVRVIVLRGEGPVAFSAGADISEFPSTRATPRDVEYYERIVLEAHHALSTSSKPTIAVIDGLCFGGGMGLAMACDLRLSSDRAIFCIPAARLGIGYGLHDVLRLVSKIGIPKTADLLLSGLPMTAFEALGAGIVQRLWPADEFETRAEAYLATIAGNAPLTLAAVKRALRTVEFRPSKKQTVTIARLVAACDASADFKEGQAAFREKRAPRFAGK